jgi:hypothetical protein
VILLSLSDRYALLAEETQAAVLDAAASYLIFAGRINRSGFGCFGSNECAP